MTYTALMRGDDGPDPVGLFDTWEEATAYAKWAEKEEGVEYEVVAIATRSHLYVEPQEPEPAPIKCLTCGFTEFEARGTRRTYHPLGPDLELDGWSEGDVEMDDNDDGVLTIYCVECSSEFTKDELLAGRVVPAAERNRNA